MGFISRLLGRGKDPSGSDVRAWAEREYRAIRYSNRLHIEDLFIVMMYSVTRFGVRHPALGGKDLPGLGEKFYARYGGDTPLFEVGCYFHFLTDLWLFDNHREHRETISLPLADRYIRLFTEALQMPGLPELFDERLDMYGVLTRRGESFQRILWYVGQLLHLAAANGKPSNYDLDNEPVMIPDALEDVALQIHLLSFVDGMVPSFRKVVARYIERTGSKSP